MPRTKLTTKSIQKDLDRASKLLNQLAETLSRISSEAATLGERSAAAGTQQAGRKAATGVKRAGKRAASKAAAGLPDTTGDFFARHVGKRKQTASQIHQAVLDSLGFEPSKAQTAILRNRLAVWLSNAVKSGSNPVSSIGSGKDRRYFRA
jgi:hypothetical protein